MAVVGIDIEETEKKVLLVGATIVDQHFILCTALDRVLT